MPSEEYQRSVNKWAARIVPLIILGATGYSVFVVVDKICVEYLIDPLGHGYDSLGARPRLAIPILVFFLLLLVLWLACYFRLMLAVSLSPGYTTRIPHPNTPESKKEQGARSILSCASTTVVKDASYPILNRTGVLQGAIPPPPGIEQFLSKDVFVCDPQGLPLFCDLCNNWKHDRTHHCSEVNRCVRRMDHYCPWVGGIVSETTIKFFIQFLFYVAAWGVYTLGFVAWAISDRMGKSDASAQVVTLSDSTSILRRSFGRVNGQWIACLALAAVLGVLFAGGMFLTTLYNAAVNRSTNEQIFKRSYNLAVRLSRRRPSRYEGPAITYPLRPSSARGDERTYAILQSSPADNIWSVSVLQNLKSVLGDSYLDWMIPLHYPPCTRHDNSLSDYPLGPDFERLCREAGIR